jgi:hypothetical protein
VETGGSAKPVLAAAPRAAPGLHLKCRRRRMQPSRNPRPARLHRVQYHSKGAIMDTSLNRAITRLAKGEFLRIRDGQGKSVALFSGSAWVTQDNDARDLVLAAGESLTLERPGLSIVQALADSAVLVLDATQNDDSLPQTAATPPQVFPLTAEELHREAKRLRDHANREALRQAAAATRRLGHRLSERAWLRLSAIAH